MQQQRLLAYWDIPEIRCTPAKEEIENRKSFTHIFIGN